MEIFGKLKLSFDGLEASEKNIFLDIACFFKGRDKEHVTRILDSFGFDPVIGITVLIEKSLLTVSWGRLDMHDLIQEMGWKIVGECFSNSRLWQPIQIHDLVMRNSKLKAIEAIMLGTKDYYFDHDDEKLDFNAEIFTSMKNLRLLDINSNSNFISDEPYFLPNKLRWLCCYDYQFSSLQLAHMRKLVGLEMYKSAIKHLWKGLKILPSLKFINMSASKELTRFPDVSGAPNLERLILSGCHRLVKVHKSVGLQKKLVHLDLRGCGQLRYLLPRMEMESLETLILSECISLERFPEISPCMRKLSKIYLDYCDQIEELPSSIKFLSALSFLNLIGCSNLKNLPNSICELKHLKSLYLHNCTRLQKLPEDIGSMVQLEELQLGFLESWDFVEPEPSLRIDELTYLCSLRKLDLSWRQFQEEDFPKNLCGLSSLEELLLCGNSKLIQLPASISHLSHLKLLELSKCRRLERLNELPSGIQVLKAKGCSSLKKIGDLSQQCGWLFRLWIFDCHKLLEDQENGRYLYKMLQQSFLQKCAAVNHRLSIAIPGSKIPSWFSEQQPGSTISLKLPPNWHTKVMGFAVCGVFYGDWEDAYPRIIFKIVNDEKLISNTGVYCINIPAADNRNLWMAYIPFSLFQQMYHDFQTEDWSNIEGNLVMTLTSTVGHESIRSGAHTVYKEDVELIPHTETCVSEYGNLVLIDKDNYQEELGHYKRGSANTYVYEEDFEDKILNWSRPRISPSSRRNVYDHTHVMELSLWSPLDDETQSWCSRIKHFTDE